MVSDRVNPEQAAIQADEDRAWALHRMRVRQIAIALVTKTMDGAAAADSRVLALALLDASAAALAKVEDSARVLGALGKIASRHGGELRAPKADVRRAAERAFKDHSRSGRRER